MGYKGIIFDLDGVLVHTDSLHYKAWKQIADRFNIPFDEVVNNRLRGVSRMESLRIILEKSERIFSFEEQEQLAEEKNEIYKQLLVSMNEKDVDADVRNTLKALKEKGLKLAIGSSSKNTKAILNQVKLYDYFDAISDGTNIVKTKPDPEVFIKAAEFIRLNPKDCLVVEDAKAGVEAAINGGFDSAGINDVVQYKIARYNLLKFSDLLNIIE